jgi:predicted RNA-binding Zn-ribbon protein involved in translation (DUF1610 family)
MERKLVGACGLYCGACSIYRAREYPGLAEELAGRFGCRPEQVDCDGCHGDLKRRWSDQDCRYWARAGELEGLRVCGPDDAYGGYEEQRRQLERLWAVGVEAWLREQAAAHACPACGTGTVWGQLCPACTFGTLPKGSG